MYEIGVEELHQLLLDGLSASRYAIANYDSLAERKCKYTLYGPSCHWLGVSIPSTLIPTRARKLTQKTRRKDYVIYELDESFRILRTIHMLDYTRIDCTYHHFDLNGVHYAYPFRGNGNQRYNGEIAVMKYADDRPVCFGLIRKPLLFMQFYEYTTQNHMTVSTYRYWPTAEYTRHGYPVDKNAPIGAPNSCVQRHCREETPAITDFSRWIK